VRWSGVLYKVQNTEVTTRGVFSQEEEGATEVYMCTPGASEWKRAELMRDVLAARAGVHAVWGKDVVSTAAMSTEIVPRLFLLLRTRLRSNYLWVTEL
jgi:uncharacterized protein (DUF779 family)